MTDDRHCPDPQHCFTYGSLMCTDIMERVAGPQSPGVPAVLHGYRRSPVRGEEYPAIVEEPGATVAGVLYRDLPATSWLRLDVFEGEEYRREAVQVDVDDGRTVTAWVYVYRAEYRHRLAAGDWDFDRFLRAGKARFLARYDGFGKVDDPAAV